MNHFSSIVLSLTSVARLLKALSERSSMVPPELSFSEERFCFVYFLVFLLMIYSLGRRDSMSSLWQGWLEPGTKHGKATASVPLINTLTNMQSTGLLYVDPKTHSAVRSTNSTHAPGHTGSMALSSIVSSISTIELWLTCQPINAKKKVLA